MNRRYQGFGVGVLGGVLVVLGAVPGVASAPEDAPSRYPRSQQLAQFLPPPPTQVPAQPQQPAGPVQSPQQPDVLVPNPQVTIDGVPVIAPAPVQVVPPFLPRAVAPPLGDIVVSDTVPRFGDTVDLGTSERVPRLVLRNAPAREVLSLLARAAGLNVVFVAGSGGTDQGVQGNAGAGSTSDGPLVTVDLQNESVQEAFTSILRITGLNASRVGRTIYVGPNLPTSARNVISRSIRLNQASADGAAGFLASLGAEGTQIVTVTTFNDVEGGGGGDENTGRIIRSQSTTQTEIRPLTFSPDQLSRAPQVLRGLLVTADARLNSLTLVGEPALVETATRYLTQLDLRRRQVAVNVKVIDVNLNALDAAGTSFSFLLGGTSFVSSGGIGVVNFGPQAPSRANAPLTDPSILNVPILPGTLTAGGALGLANQFLAQLFGTVQNGNAKILTDPTLIIQEGQEAELRLTQEVITDIQTTREVVGTTVTTTTTIVRGDAGLTLGLTVPRIDDNGFVSINLSPRVAAPSDQFTVGDNRAVLLSVRQLSSGEIRIRDGQTLVLAGIIQENDRVDVSRVPILGDLPIIGALFRSTIRTNQRAEVIVLVTPQVLDDSDQSVFGYSYTPSEEVQELLQRSPRSPQR